MPYIDIRITYGDGPSYDPEIVEMNATDISDEDLKQIGEATYEDLYDHAVAQAFLSAIRYPNHTIQVTSYRDYPSTIEVDGETYKVVVVRGWGDEISSFCVYTLEDRYVAGTDWQGYVDEETLRDWLVEELKQA